MPAHLSLCVREAVSISPTLFSVALALVPPYCETETSTRRRRARRRHVCDHDHHLHRGPPIDRSPPWTEKGGGRGVRTVPESRAAPGFARERAADAADTSALSSEREGAVIHHSADLLRASPPIPSPRARPGPAVRIGHSVDIFAYMYF
uniref:Uncharacterized protein n=1 Tax=Oryza punctata TaxID=4537 RepID=A0A0E0MHW4_ORYPU